MHFLKNLFSSFLPAVGWWLLVLVLMCTPGKDLPELGSWTDLIQLDKIVHICTFGLMALLFMKATDHRSYASPQKKQWALKISLAAAVWGLTIEFIQHFWIPGRSFDLFDVVADAVGAALAFLFYRKRYL